MLTAGAVSVVVPLVASLVGAAVAILSAVFLWKFQVLGKRRTEIAEAALMDYYLCLDRLTWCRLEGRGLPEPHEIGSYENIETDGSYSEFTLVFARINSQGELFAAIEKHHRLCAIHFGRRSSDIIGELLAYTKALRRKALMGIARRRRCDGLARLNPNPATNPELRAAQRELDEISAFVFADPEDDPLKKLKQRGLLLERELAAALR